MEKKEIIFFDQLGFGWVVDRHCLPDIFHGRRRHQRLSESGLFERVYRDKDSRAE